MLNGHASAYKENIVTNVKHLSKKFNVKSLKQAVNEFFTPLKEMYNFFIPLQAGLQNVLTPLPVDHPPTAGLRITNP